MKFIVLKKVTVLNSKFKIIGLSIIAPIIIGLIIICNFGKVYYLYSLIDFNINLNQRERVVDLIKTEKLKNYTFKGSTNWINLPDTLKHLSEEGNVRVEKINNKVSVFFYLKFRNTEEPIGFAYFDSELTTKKIMNISNTNSLFFGDKWVKKINENWYYIENITNRETAPAGADF